MAVKFIKRPLPKVLQTNILREFTVRLPVPGGAGGVGAGSHGRARRTALVHSNTAPRCLALPRAAPAAARRSRLTWAAGTNT